MHAFHAFFEQALPAFVIYYHLYIGFYSHFRTNHGGSFLYYM